jgi:pimeloyl-ACP methyl ester carboxylesterase
VHIVALALAGLGLLVVGAVGFVYAMPEKATHLAFDVMRHRSGLVRKEIELPDGLRYVYLEGGQGEPLMLLHGFGADKDNFTPVARFLTSRYRVIVPDSIGFGESSRPQEADYTSAAQAERLRALAQALGITKLHLGGNSMGGHIAMMYAKNHDTEVESLWLIDTAGVWSVPKKELDEISRKTGHNMLIVKSGEDLEQLLAFSLSDPPFIPRPMIHVIAQPRIENSALEERIFAQLEGDSVEERIAGLATPALILWGAEDRVIDVATADVLRNLLPHSKCIIMPDIGHMPMFESPRQSAADYLQFRDSLQKGELPRQEACRVKGRAGER